MTRGRRRGLLLAGVVLVAAGAVVVVADRHSGPTHLSPPPSPPAVAGTTPTPPADVSLSADGVDNVLTVSWAPPTGPAPTRYDIGVFENSGPERHQVGAVVCFAPCTDEKIDATPGSSTSVVVDASSGAARSIAVAAGPVQVPRPCSLACLTVAPSGPGTETRPAAGFVITSGPPPSSPGLLQTLRPTQWRTNLATLAATPPATLAALRGATIDELLSDDWLQERGTGGYAPLPWADWSAYSHWVTATVQRGEALAKQKGFHIAYWEVQNEPFGGNYYLPSSSPPISETVANVEQQFLVAYRAVKAADPSAAVVGPSLISWADNPVAAGGRLDMATFLQFCASHGIALAAVSFHDNNYGPLPGWYAADGRPAQPQEVQWAVSRLRRILQTHPSVGRPVVLVNEYGDPSTWLEPGWDVGRIAALEDAGVQGANRSCWDTCSGAGLDGLGGRPGYEIYRFYATMTGRRLAMTSSYTGVTGLGVMDPNGTIRVMVGRHQACTGSGCPPATAGQTVTLRVPAAWRAATATAEIVGTGGAEAAAPVSVAGSGEATLVLRLGDGEAALVTISPTR